MARHFQRHDGLAEGADRRRHAVRGKRQQAIVGAKPGAHPLVDIGEGEAAERLGAVQQVQRGDPPIREILA